MPYDPTDWDTADDTAKETAQHFFADPDGAHVTENAGDATTGANALLDSSWLHFRVGTDDVSKFGASGSQIGKDDEAHLVMDYNSMELQDENDLTFLFIGDLRDANGEYELTETFTGDGISTEYYPRYHVSDFVLVTVGGVATTAYTYWQPDWEWAVDFTTAPADGAAIVIDYKTTDLVPVQTFGGRGGMVGDYSTAEGYDTIASGFSSHAEGGGRRGQMGGTVEASGMSSHAEGFDATASGDYSHAEGRGSASGTNSHAENSGTATGATSHAEGAGVASGIVSHAEGSGTASGTRSHAEGLVTLASSDNQHVSGKYNVDDSADTYAEIIGNGTAANARSNARTLDWSGNEELQGELYLGGCTVNGETPYPATRYNTGNSTLQYYDGASWTGISTGGIGFHVYAGTFTANVGTNQTSYMAWTASTFRSTFNVTSGHESDCFVSFGNADVSLGSKGTITAEWWPSSYNPYGWRVRWQNQQSGNQKFSYMVLVPDSYSTV